MKTLLDKDIWTMWAEKKLENIYSSNRVLSVDKYDYGRVNFEQLKSSFEKYGFVESIYIHCCYAHVFFYEKNDAEEAIKNLENIVGFICFLSFNKKRFASVFRRFYHLKSVCAFFFPINPYYFIL
jgi:hypothetical protein